MSERPLICCSESVRTFLDGRKTQTRRTRGLEEINKEPDNYKRPFFNKVTGLWEFLYVPDQTDILDISLEVKCLYGKVGDRLWVREKTKVIDSYYNRELKFVAAMTRDEKVKLRYESDGAETDWIIYPQRLASIEVGHCITRGCYKEAARIWLEITNIRVERVREIDENDACAEGCELYTPETNLGAERTFERLWDSLNAKRGYPWEKNPWVWILEVKRIEKR